MQEKVKFQKYPRILYTNNSKKLSSNDCVSEYVYMHTQAHMTFEHSSI